MISTVLSYGIDRDGVIAEPPVQDNKRYTFIRDNQISVKGIYRKGARETGTFRTVGSSIRSIDRTIP